MKRLLLLSIFLCSSLCGYAAVPLTGAFGLKFGEVFTPNDSNTQGAVRTDERARLLAYRFQPAAQNRHFIEYWVYITPVTHRIYRIVAVARANTEQLAIEQQNAILTVARDRYDGDFSIHDRWVNQGTRSVTVRPPLPQPDGSVLWQVAYTDQALGGRIFAANNGMAEEVDETGL